MLIVLKKQILVILVVIRADYRHIEKFVVLKKKPRFVWQFFLFIYSQMSNLVITVKFSQVSIFYILFCFIVIFPPPANQCILIN